MIKNGVVYKQVQTRFLKNIFVQEGWLINSWKYTSTCEGWTRNRVVPSVAYLRAPPLQNSDNNTNNNVFQPVT